uniref:Uncharacterized protein n=1 Tax=Lactuca sativa TaxID=4236 RepID=A0A9R1UL36_LACSA|nr:hypothetical protein LSAT_V11C800415760 [Lactuca sativa]
MVTSIMIQRCSLLKLDFIRGLNMYFLSLILDEMSREIQGGVPWCMFFSDDIVLVGHISIVLGWSIFGETLLGRLVHWRASFGVSYDTKVPLKLKGKFKMVVVRPTMMYGFECCLSKNEHGRKLEVTEIMMLRWTCGWNLLDMILNVVIRNSHVRRRLPSITIRMVESNLIDGKRRRGHPRRKWEYNVRLDMEELALFKDMTSYIRV